MTSEQAIAVKEHFGKDTPKFIFLFILVSLFSSLFFIFHAKIILATAGITVGLFVAATLIYLAIFFFLLVPKAMNAQKAVKGGLEDGRTEEIHNKTGNN